MWTFARTLVTRLAPVSLIVMVAAPTAAQQPGPCPEGQSAVPTLGISALECMCAVFVDQFGPGRDLYQFDLEPRINGVAEDGPSAGLLFAGDVVVAVDGVLITTDDGGRRFSQVVPGTPVRLTVRRDGREVDVTVTPGVKCRPDPARARRGPGGKP